MTVAAFCYVAEETCGVKCHSVPGSPWARRLESRTYRTTRTEQELC